MPHAPLATARSIPGLRRDSLLELADDPDLVDNARVVEIRGSPILRSDLGADGILALFVDGAAQWVIGLPVPADPQRQRPPTVVRPAARRGYRAVL